MEVDFFSWWNTCGYVLILIFSILSGLVEGMCVFYLLWNRIKRRVGLWWAWVFFNVVWCFLVSKFGYLAVMYMVIYIHPYGSPEHVSDLLSLVYPQGMIIGLAIIFALVNERNDKMKCQQKTISFTGKILNEACNRN